MLTIKQMNKYADVLLWGLKKARNKRYKKGDIVLVNYDLAALKLAEITQAKLLSLGMNPVLRLGMTPQMELNFFNGANSRQLVFQPPGNKELFQTLHGAMYLLAPESLTHLQAVDPKKIATSILARKPFRDILFKREENGEFGWTLCMFPTTELAKHSGLSCKEYTRQVINACYINKQNPVYQWDEIFSSALSIKKWLNRMNVRWYLIESQNFSLKITPGERRKWIGVSGHNIPSFEIFHSPDWRGTEGTYFANQPSYRAGNYVKDVHLEFKKGKVIKVKAESGEKFALKQFSMDKGANKVGEFSLTDKRFSKIKKFMANTLFDENHGGRYGNCHIALGSSYSDTYRGNPAELTVEKKKELGFNDSALHWDLVNTEKKTVTAHLSSGKKSVIYDNGMFRY